MNTLVSAFWGEGISDERFLPVLIQRTLEHLMLACAEGEWDVREPLLFHPNKVAVTFVDQVMDLSRQASGFHILFVHTDADAPDAQLRAMPHKILPALKAVRQATPEEEYCREIVPVIPVVKIENWKLADCDALREALATELTDEALGLNIGSRQLEEKSASKELLADILRKVNYGRRIPIVLEDLDAALAKGISLRKIYRFRSFQNFVERLKVVLTDQNIIRADCRSDF
jgi:hypothetical protein